MFTHGRGFLQIQQYSRRRYWSPRIVCLFLRLNPKCSQQSSRSYTIRPMHEFPEQAPSPCTRAQSPLHLKKASDQIKHQDGFRSRNGVASRIVLHSLAGSVLWPNEQTSRSMPSLQPTRLPSRRRAQINGILTLARIRSLMTRHIGD